MPKTEPLDTSRPVFVKAPTLGYDVLTLRGRSFEVDQEVPWQEMKLPLKTIQFLYGNHQLKHSEKLEAQTRGKIGDGLDQLTYQELQNIITYINKKIADHTSDKLEYEKKRIKLPQGGRQSTSALMGRIRGWRNRYGHEDLFGQKQEV